MTPITTKLTKSQFLLEHNKLSPLDLQATPELLTRFQEEKSPLLKDANWSFKLRMPFISWMMTLPKEKEKRTRKSSRSTYVNYPETK